MSLSELRAFLAAAFPHAPELVLDALTADGVTLRFTACEAHLRPGGTISGPTLMGLADAAVYLAILARNGSHALAVTSHLSIDFLAKPSPGDIVATSRLLKLGKRLAVGAVELRSGDVLVAHASATYSLPS